jgi:NADH-quinone oxidoreductase subunit K
MASVSMEYGLILAGILFTLGLAGVLVRRNLLFMLLSIEIMLNAAGLAFVVAGARWAQPDGQVIFLFILTMAAAEVSVGLALILQIYRHMKTLDADAADEMRG